MARGGKREGAGRKSSWNGGRTKSVKLPELLIPEILEFARMLDSSTTCPSKISELCSSAEAKLARSRSLQGKEVFLNRRIKTGTIGEIEFESPRGEKEEVLLPMSVVDQRQPSSFSLTPDQASALFKMKEFVGTPRQKYFRLTGYAGTGKSHLIVQLMNWLRNQKIKFVAASPTNKAVKNLKQLAEESGVSIEAHTVAQLLGQQPEINENTGKEEFISKGNESIDDYEVVLIDEFSMISKSNFEEINQAVWYSATKVIFVGDAAQLPPVGESEPIIASHNYINHQATLNSIVRYDGEIAKVAEQIRSDHAYNKSLYPFKTTEDKTIVCLSRNKWLDIASELFKSQEYQTNRDHVRLLTWRNKTASALNDYIRTQLWGEAAPDYVEGDRLIAKIPVFRPNPGAKGKNKWRIIMNNSEECEVIGEAKLKTDRKTKWEYWSVPAKTETGLKLDLRILTPSSQIEREEYMQSLKETKRWREYYHILKSFDNVPYAYAITTHKAQGSSINYVLPDVTDMKGCPDLQKILYTALTRAKIQALIPKL